MNRFVEFMNSAVGRIARIVLGLAVITWSLTSLGGAVGPIVAIVGLVPLVMGVWGRCLVELAVPRRAAHNA